MKGVQLGLQGFGQFAGLVVVAAKASDSAAGHFKDMEKILSGRHNLIKDGIGVPIRVGQAVVLVLFWT